MKIKYNLNFPSQNIQKIVHHFYYSKVEYEYSLQDYLDKNFNKKIFKATIEGISEMTDYDIESLDYLDLIVSVKVRLFIFTGGHLDTYKDYFFVKSYNEIQTRF